MNSGVEDRMAMYARQQGKSYRNAIMLRLVIEPSGLPKTNMIFCRSKHMIKWDCKTGEVSTIEYKLEGTKVGKVLVDDEME